MSMPNFILTLLRYYPISHLRSALQTNFRFHTFAHGIRDVNIQLHTTFSSLLSNFRPHTIICDIRDVNVQLHPNSSPLLSNFRTQTVVRDICDIRIHLQSSMTSVMSLFSCTLPSLLLSNFRFHTSSLTPVMSMLNFILNSFPSSSKFPSPQYVADQFPISHSCPWHLWYPCLVTFV